MQDGSNALMLACGRGDVAVVELLLKAPGIHVNTARWHNWRQPQETGRTALMYAARGGHAAIVALLLAMPGIEVGAESAVRHPPQHSSASRDLHQDGSTAESMARSAGHEDTVALLQSSEASSEE